MTGSPERATSRFIAWIGLAPFGLFELHDAPVSIRPQVEALTNRLSECAAMLFPGAARDLFGDERVGRFGVGNAQQRFRKAHQHDALVGREAIFVHEGIDAGVLALVGARGVHQAAGDVGGAAALVLGENRTLDQAPTSRCSSIR